MGTSFAPVEVFYSFAEADASLLKRLEQHLSMLRHEGEITTWHKRQILAGNNWQTEVDQHVNAASLILLLISPDFLASDYQYGVEMQRAIQRHDNNEACVIPILLRDCDWKSASFCKFQIIPRNGKPITSWHNRDEAFANVATEIRATLENIQRAPVNAPSITLPKIWQIPYQRNPVFTGRDELLLALTRVLQADHPVMRSQPEAISGLGGIGKTQLAVEYAYRTSSQYQAVFWVAAETQETLTSGYAAIARALNLQEKDEPDQTLMLQAVQRWLRMHTDWLLILDNADNLHLVQSFVPAAFGGRILLTTRDQATGRFAHRNEIDTLTNEEGSLLLLRRAGMLATQGTLEQVVDLEIALARQISMELGNLPLALDQAGAYIEETRCDLLSYRQQYQHRRMFLLQRRGALAADHPEAVATTWSLSFEKIEQANLTAVQLLRFCAFLAPTAIPEDLLVQFLKMFPGSLVPKEAGGQRPEIWSSPKGVDTIPYTKELWEIDEAVAMLRAYSLIQRNASEKTLSIHQLVQVVLQDTMDAEQQQKWAERLVKVMQKAFPSAEIQNGALCDQLLPHALVCTNSMAQWDLFLPEELILLQQIEDFLYHRARFKEAERISQRVLVIQEHMQKPIYDQMQSHNRLAILYLNQGMYKEAESLIRQALSLYKPGVSPVHSRVAQSLTTLALIYKDQGLYQNAEGLFQQALTINMLVLGSEHPDTAHSLNNIGVIYADQGRYNDAEPFYRNALAIREQILGLNHYDTAQSIDNLANLYQAQERFRDAESLHKQALTIREQILGPEHPDTAYSLSNLGVCYVAQNMYKEARPLYQRALSIRKKTLGPEHIDTAISAFNLAACYLFQEDFEQAESLYERAMSIYEKILRPDHTNVISCIKILSNLYCVQGKHKQAEALWQHVVPIRKHLLGLEHSDTAAALNALAVTYIYQEKYAEAEALFQDVLEIRKQTVGANHADTAQSLNNLAFVYQNQGKYREAEALFKQALEVWEQELGVSHLTITLGLNNLARLYNEQGKYSEAEPLLQRTLAIYEQQLGREHPQTQAFFENYTAHLQAIDPRRETQQ